MATEYFGYQRTTQPSGQIASSEWATLRIGGSMIRFLQSVTVNYQQRIESRFELGSPTLYYITGQPQGSISWSRNVGRGGFFSGLGALQNSCGKLLNVSLGLDGNGGCSVGANPGGNAITFGGAVPEAVTININSGQLEVVEGGSIRVSLMQVG